jgi:hypothetical protein
MKKEETIQSVLNNLSKKLGTKLTSKMGKNRLLDIATEIADYKEQVDWPNTPQEIRWLRDRIHYIPARIGLNLNTLRLSKKSEADVQNALWKTLQSTFPTLKLNQ